MKPFGPPRPNLRSPELSCIRGAILTDARIDHYARRGYYGEAARANATRPKPKKRAKRFDAMAAALELLS